jgi:outer membrane protein TolC
MLDKIGRCKRFSATLRLSAVPFLTAVLTAQIGPAHSDQIRRITLEQVKETVDPARGALTRLGQLSVEAAKQHRLGAEADYYPKFGAMFVNLHYTDFLGDVLTVRRPILGTASQVAIPLFSQDQTVAALTFTQPITPLLQVRQLVRIARADERIAMAKARVSMAKSTRDRQLEEAYFKLLIAQRKLTSAQLRLRGAGSRTLHAMSSSAVMRTSDGGPEPTASNTELVNAAAEVRKLMAALNRMMGWPDDTELELVSPEPLEEDISLREISNKPAAGVDVVEAEQTVVKARAAATISKLEYVPTVAAVSGYLFQNVLPSVPSNLGYGGVVASYNLFDFGKRERAVKEARAKVEMAEIALQLTKDKAAAELKKSYFELERSRQLSKVAQRMGSSVALVVNASSNPDSIDVQAARAEIEVDLLEADFAHRRAFAAVRALTGGTD